MSQLHTASSTSMTKRNLCQDVFNFTLIVKLTLKPTQSSLMKILNMVISTFFSHVQDWLFAKMCVANADAVIHQFESHLLLTHLCTEALVIELHRQVHDIMDLSHSQC